MHRCLPVAPVTFVKRWEGAVLTWHSIQLLDEAGTWLSGSVGGGGKKEPSSLGRGLQGCSSPALDALGRQRPICRDASGWELSARWGKPVLLGVGCLLRIALLRGFLPVGVKVSGEQSQRAEHMALVRRAARSCYLP